VVIFSLIVEGTPFFLGAYGVAFVKYESFPQHGYCGLSWSLGVSC